MKINTNIPEDFREIVSMLNPDGFVAKLLESGEIEKITGNYSNDVRLMCNNAMAWIISKIKNSSYMYEVEVVEGHFNEWEHTWIKAGDYYLDMTLAQFLDCPKIVVSKIGKIDGYKEDTIYNPLDWSRKTCKELGMM